MVYGWTIKRSSDGPDKGIINITVMTGSGKCDHIVAL